MEVGDDFFGQFDFDVMWVGVCFDVFVEVIDFIQGMEVEQFEVMLYQCVRNGDQFVVYDIWCFLDINIVVQ